MPKINKHEWSNETKSCLSTIYSDHEALTQCAPVVTISGKTFTLEDIRKRLREQPTVTVVPKNKQLVLDPPKLITAMTKLKNSLQRIPKLDDSIVIDLTCVQQIPGVKVFPAAPYGQQPKMVLLPPRITINLENFREHLHPMSGIRINTGYIVTIPTSTMGQALVNDKIVNTTVGTQVDVILLPLLSVVHSNQIIPALCARDPDDTGMLTINLTIGPDFDLDKLDAKKRILSFGLEAYRVINPMAQVTAHSAPQSTDPINYDVVDDNIAIFKTKDSKLGRFVKNPKAQLDLTTFDVTTQPKVVLIDMLNERTPSKLKINNICTLFTSRKREWSDPDVVTMAGLFTTTSLEHVVAPSVCKIPITEPAAVVPVVEASADAPATPPPLARKIINTHGITFIVGKVSVFSRTQPYEKIQKTEAVHYLNGAFHDISCYAVLYKQARHLFTSVKQLGLGARQVNNVVKADSNTYNKTKLMLIYDHHHTLPLTMLRELYPKNEMDIFRSKPSDTLALSITVSRAMHTLVQILYSERFTAKELDELTLITSFKKTSGDSLLAKIKQGKNVPKTKGNEVVDAVTPATAVAAVNGNGSNDAVIARESTKENLDTAGRVDTDTVANGTTNTNSSGDTSTSSDHNTDASVDNNRSVASPNNSDTMDQNNELAKNNSSPDESGDDSSDVTDDHDTVHDKIADNFQLDKQHNNSTSDIKMARIVKYENLTLDCIPKSPKSETEPTKADVVNVDITTDLPNRKRRSGSEPNSECSLDNADSQSSDNTEPSQKIVKTL